MSDEKLQAFQNLLHKAIRSVEPPCGKTIQRGALMSVLISGGGDLYAFRQVSRRQSIGPIALQPGLLIFPVSRVHVTEYHSPA